MKYKILKKYIEDSLETYELIPFESNSSNKSKLYRKNLGRQVMVGKEFTDQENPDIFTFSNETSDSIDMEVKEIVYDFFTSGYYNLEYIDKDGKVARDAVHRVVCFAWNPDYDPFKHEVHHIDRNKLNNRADNLMAVPPLFNAAVEFKAGNPEARKYMSAAIISDKKTPSYSDFLDTCRIALEQERYFVFNELMLNPSKDILLAMKYILEKNGFSVTKKDEN
jgi:hypothetical protein